MPRLRLTESKHRKDYRSLYKFIIAVQLSTILSFYQEIEVLLSELGSLRPDSEVYKGGENSVLFRADLSNTKSQLKKEQSSLRKKTGKTKTSSEALSF